MSQDQTPARVSTCSQADGSAAEGGRGTLSRREMLAGCAAGLAAWSLAPSAQTAESVRPAGPTAPLAMWALTGTLTSEPVQRQLDAFAAAGWGVVLYPRWGLELDYLGSQWFERIRFIVQQAAQRNVEVWLYDEFCWPSGHAKGLATEGRPELEAQLLYVEQDGRQRVERVPGSANLLLPAATQRFLDVTHARYADAVGEYFGSTIRAIFTDEPSLALQHQPRKPGDRSWRLAWSEELDRALGGDFPARLAAAGSEAGRPGLWRDYWAAFTRVFHEAWIAPIARWCQAHHIAFSGHLLGEHGFGDQVAYNGSLRQQLASFGIPGIDEIHTRTDPATCEALTLASIAEFPGRERMAEVYALGPPWMSLETMRAMVDLMSVCGVDRYVLAICPHDLRGGVYKREYCGISGVQQPWFRRFARPFAEYVAEAARRARQAQPLGIAWPSDEELWSVAGPDPKRSEPLKQLTQKTIAAAREAIRSRLPGRPTRATAGSAVGPERRRPLEANWSFELASPNSWRLDGATLHVVDQPRSAELSVQRQLVRAIRVNGYPLNLATAADDTAFDASYARVPLTRLLRWGENSIEIDPLEPQPLKFLPAVIVWGEFAVDAAGQLVAPPRTLALGDWRPQGLPSFCGVGRYRATVTWAAPPASLIVDSGGYPVRAVVNGQEAGVRGWSPMEFDLRPAARPGANTLELEITSTIGHLFVPQAAPPIGLLGAWTADR